MCGASLSRPRIFLLRRNGPLGDLVLEPQRAGLASQRDHLVPAPLGKHRLDGLVDVGLVLSVLGGRAADPELAGAPNSRTAVESVGRGGIDRLVRGPIHVAVVSPLYRR